MSAPNVATQIPLSRMSQLIDAVGPKDDWTGITDAAIRRKRQNRLNVRAHRRRKAQQQQALASPSAPTTEHGIPCWVEDQQAVLCLPTAIAKALHNTKHPLLSTKTSSTKFNRVIFPLSSDHLITLLQFNVLRGNLVNRHLLSRLQPNLLHDNDDCSSPSLHVLPDLDDSLPLSLPPSLHPTLLQRTVPHESWIDVIPHPVMRDNLIQAAGHFDEDELWSDTIGGLFEGFPASDIEQRGVIMWSPPWHVCGWEVSEGFWRKWSWALKGCGDVLEATNRWRIRRGEEPLGYEVLH